MGLCMEVGGTFGCWTLAEAPPWAPAVTFLLEIRVDVRPSAALAFGSRSGTLFGSSERGLTGLGVAFSTPDDSTRLRFGAGSATSPALNGSYSLPKLPTGVGVWARFEIRCAKIHLGRVQSSWRGQGVFLNKPMEENIT